MEILNLVDDVTQIRDVVAVCCLALSNLTNQEQDYQNISDVLHHTIDGRLKILEENLWEIKENHYGKN